MNRSRSETETVPPCRLLSFSREKKSSASNQEPSILKRSIADLVVEDNNKYIVEIDRAYTSVFLYKAFLDPYRIVVDRLSPKEDYSTIKKSPSTCFSLSQIK